MLSPSWLHQAARPISRAPSRRCAVEPGSSLDRPALGQAPIHQRTRRRTLLRLRAGHAARARRPASAPTLGVDTLPAATLLPGGPATRRRSPRPRPPPSTIASASGPSAAVPAWTAAMISGAPVKFAAATPKSAGARSPHQGRSPIAGMRFGIGRLPLVGVSVAGALSAIRAAPIMPAPTHAARPRPYPSRRGETPRSRRRQISASPVHLANVKAVSSSTACRGEDEARGKRPRRTSQPPPRPPIHGPPRG